MTLEWIDRKTVDLTVVLMKARNLDAGTIEIVDNYLTIRGSSRNVSTELPMRPLDSMNV